MSIETKGRLSFQGGIHPRQSKKLTVEGEIQQGPRVKRISVMLSQHIGAICQPIVEKGSRVRAGEKVGDSDAFVSAPVHSPVDGVVKEISLQSHAILGRIPAVIIETDDENSPKAIPSSRLMENFNDNDYSAEQICQSIRDTGIVGMGGAGFPTRVKVEPNPKQPKNTMIINGCECEPYITGDYRIMLEWTQQVVVGIKLGRKASGCREVFIAIEDNKPRAIEALHAAVEKEDDIKVVPVKTKYPQGGERQLIQSVLGKTVPSGGIPPMIGVIVLNVATAAAIAEAVVCGQALTHRVVTVTGEAIGQPGNYYVPIGTPISDLLEFCGGVTKKSATVLLGGPMMGIAIADMQTPTTKTTGAVTVLTKKEVGKAKFVGRKTPCIRCGRCLHICPEHLNPTKIAHAVKKDALDVAQSYYIGACIECGCCSYICPANIELTGYIKTGKIFLAREKKRMPE